MSFPDLINCLKHNSINFKINQKYSLFSSLKCSDVIPLVILPQNVEQILFCSSVCAKLQIKYIVAGSLTNTLFINSLYDYAIISTYFLKSPIELHGSNLTISAGHTLLDVAKFLTARGYKHFNRLATIPGTLGGAIANNSGCFGSVISDYLVSVDIYDTSSQQVINYHKSLLGYSYRDSIIKSEAAVSGVTKKVVLSAHFDLGFYSLSARDLSDDLSTIMRFRKLAQPYTSGTLGSVFATKNIYFNIRFFGPLIYISCMIGSVLDKFLNLKISKSILRLSFELSKLILKPSTQKALSSFSLNCLEQPHTPYTLQEYAECVSDLKSILSTNLKVELNIYGDLI